MEFAKELGKMCVMEMLSQLEITNIKIYIYMHLALSTTSIVTLVPH